jgi:hypothetical protein
MFYTTVSTREQNNEKEKTSCLLTVSERTLLQNQRRHGFVGKEGRK